LADRSSSQRPDSDEQPSAGPSGKPESDHAPGLGEQFGRTRNAVLGLISSHIDLAKAEFSEIGGQIKRAAALGGMALLLLLLTGMLIAVGMPLFLGQALFGSVGWGVLIGSELLLCTAALLVLAIIDLSWRRAASSFVVALGVGLVVFGVLAVDWNWVSTHYSSMPPHLVLAVGAGVVFVGLLGAVLAGTFGRGPGLGGFFAGAFAGVLLGLLAAANPSHRVAAAVGLASLLLFWPIVAAVLVFRHGIDTAKLRKRFVPDQTIETTKETIEWVREQMPLGRKS